MDKINHQQLLDCMHETGLIPVFNHTDSNVAKKVLDACYDGGVRVFEFTNRGENALAVFGELVTHTQQYSDLYLGIGTLFTKEDASHFLDEGAHFLVSPALIPEIAHFANQKEVFWVPGCGTVTEMYQALQLGAKLLKAFPGNVLGPGFIKSVKAVYPEVPIMPTGGVKPTEENLSAWYNAGVHCVGMGSQLFNKEVIESGRFDDLTESVSNTIQTIKKFKK
ncbi:MAG: bifunctional 4-hydroxy-2-oxoglutarate aldolase/2-dehydro-3-deoxy-phosphogluconate aldolase [Bacteroidota bacterium]